MTIYEAAERARKAGLVHLSISPIGKTGWQVATRYANDGGYRVAIDYDLEIAVREAFMDPKLRAQPRTDLGLPPETDLDEEAASLI